MVLQWSCILWFWPWLPAAAGLYGWLQWRRQAARGVAQRVVVETQAL